MEMKRPKLVILRGRPASGKSTAFAGLRDSKKLDDWVLIDYPEMKRWIKNIDKNKELRKKVLFAFLKEVMKDKKNIIVEEMSKETIMKYIGRYIKKYNYKIVVFQFTVETEEAKIRDIRRVADPEHSHSELVDIEKLHKMHDERFDKNAILIDCNKLSKIQVVELILMEIRGLG